MTTKKKTGSKMSAGMRRMRGVRGRKTCGDIVMLCKDGTDWIPTVMELSHDAAHDALIALVDNYIALDAVNQQCARVIEGLRNTVTELRARIAHTEAAFGTAVEGTKLTSSERDAALTELRELKSACGASNIAEELKATKADAAKMRRELETLRSERGKIDDDTKVLVSRLRAEHEVQVANLNGDIRQLEAHCLGLANKVRNMEDEKSNGSMDARELLAQAGDIVGGGNIPGQRRAANGAPERCFGAIAAMWNGYLNARPEGTPLSAVDAAQLMILFKVARSVAGRPVRGHFYDMAGYAALAGELALTGPQPAKASLPVLEGDPNGANAAINAHMERTRGGRG